MLHFLTLFSCRALHNNKAPEHLISYKDKECGWDVKKLKGIRGKKEKAASWGLGEHQLEQRRITSSRKRMEPRKLAILFCFCQRVTVWQTVLAARRQPLPHTTLGVFRLVLKWDFEVNFKKIHSELQRECQQDIHYDPFTTEQVALTWLWNHFSELRWPSYVT